MVIIRYEIGEALKKADVAGPMQLVIVSQKTTRHLCGALKELLACLEELDTELRREGVVSFQIVLPPNKPGAQSDR